MKLCVVTAVYHLRKTRPLEYYLAPAIHLLEDFSNSEVNVMLFTDLPADLFPKSNNLKVVHKTPDELADDMWGEPNWRSVYSTALSDRPDHRFEEKNIPELIAIWLGKLTMMEIATQGVDCVLWQDSGIRMGRVFGKQTSNYNKCYSSATRYQRTIDNLVNKHSVVFMGCDGHVNPYHGVDMKKYDTDKKGYHIRAGFLLAKSSEVPALKADVKKHWLRLIANNDYGTEENPLTLCQWERPQSLVLSYDEWLSRLNIGSEEQRAKQILL